MASCRPAPSPLRQPRQSRSPAQPDGSRQGPGAEALGQDRRLHDTSCELRGTVARALGDIRSASRAAGTFGRRLAKLSGHLRAPVEAPHIAAAVSALRVETARMVSASRDIAMRMQQSEREIARLKSQLRSLERAALTDPLTGLGNRKALEIRLRDLARHAAQRDGVFSLLMIDVDRFKAINDDFGHQAGDEILRIIGRIFRARLKGRDVACRFGGDEFAVILPETELTPALRLAESLRQSLATRPLVDKRRGDRLGPVTLSIGVAQFHPAEALEDLIYRADSALYAAKQCGRNALRPSLKARLDPPPALRVAAARPQPTA